MLSHADVVEPLPELLGRHARRLGDKVCFEDRLRRVTYRELERRTARLAGHLAGLGLARGDRVAVLLGNRVEAVESLLAVTRASGVGVPLAPGSPEEELARLLDDSGARVLITDAACTARRRTLLSRPGLAVVMAEGGAEDGAGHRPPAKRADGVTGGGANGVLRYEELAGTEPRTPARDDLAPDEVAWLLYTSGSSGVPKGVLSTQRNRLSPVAAGLVGGASRPGGRALGRRGDGGACRRGAVPHGRVRAGGGPGPADGRAAAGRRDGRGGRRCGGGGRPPRRDRRRVRSPPS